MRFLRASLCALAALAATSTSAFASDPQETLVGELAVLHTDGEPGGGSTDTYTLATGDGQVEVRFSGAHPTYALEGSVVQLDGTRAADGSLRVDLGADPGALSVLATGGNGGGSGGGELLAAPTPGSVLVMLVNFTDNRSRPYTAASAEAGMFGASGSVDALYRDSSYGLLDLSGEVRGWYELNRASTGCDVDAWMRDARIAAGATLDGFAHFVLAFPSVASCQWAGLGELGGNYTWVQGNAFSVAVTGHELGHNLGFHHASSYACTSGVARVVLSASCTGPNTSAGEYGDPFDVMGDAYRLRQFSAFHKSEAPRGGWLGTSQTITASGSYALTSSSSTSSGARALRIARPNGEELWLELRSPSGEFDDFLPSDSAVTGVTVRVAKPGFALQTKLLDCNPEQAPTTQSFANAQLQPGQTFTDPLSGVSVRTDSVGPLGASVSVTVPTSADTTPPIAPTLIGGPDGTGSVDLAWYALSDASGIARYDVIQNGLVVNATSATSWRTGAPAPGKSAIYTVRGVDGAGNIGPQSAPLTVLTALPPPPPPPPIDAAATIAPPGKPQALVVTLAKRRLGTFVRFARAGSRRIATVATLAWRAPTGGAAAYEVRRNGKRIAVVPRARFLDPSVTSLGVRRVTYTVTSIGRTGLRSRGASVTVQFAAR